MFRTVPLSIIRSFSLYTQQWYMSYRFADSLRAASGRFRAHTHTHTHFMRDLSSSEPKGNSFFLIFPLDGPPFDELLKTATLHNRQKC